MPEDPYAKYKQAQPDEDPYAKYKSQGSASTTSVPGMEQLGGTPPGAPSVPLPAGLKTPSVPMYNQNGLITDAGANVPMGTAAQIATAPLAATKTLLEDSGKNVSTGIKRAAKGAKNRAWYNPIPSSEEVGGFADVAKGVGEAALPIALGSNPIGTVVGTAVGVPVGAGVQYGAEAVGVPKGYAEGIGMAAGSLAGDISLHEVPSVSDAANGLADTLNESAQKGYNQVLGATTKANKLTSQRVVSGYNAPAPDLGRGATAEVPGLIDRGVTALTRKGLAGKLNDAVSTAGEQLESAWNALPMML